MNNTSLPRRDRAFTLIEVLVTITILTAIMLLTGIMVSNTQKTIRAAKNEASQFREARRAFDTITTRLSQATLNTYWDYDDPNDPKAYVRQSELHFVSGDAEDLLSQSNLPGHAVFFNAPFGFAGSDASGTGHASDPYRDLESLLNAWGYFISYSEDPDVPGFIRSKPWFQAQSRFRLYELRQPSEELEIYQNDLRAENLNRTQAYDWFRQAVPSDPSAADNLRPLADDILALIISPRKAVPEGSPEKPWDLAPDYLYDSREKQWGSDIPRTKRNHNQLPPLIEVTMVAVDQKTWKSYQAENGTGRPDFGLDGLFQKAADYEEDIAKLENELNEAGLEYRIFSATIGMRTAKWSDEIIN
ncbi:MAG: Verru_Chthon cassette protein C [Verrucomicrobiales bacterium]